MVLPNKTFKEIMISIFSNGSAIKQELQKLKAADLYVLVCLYDSLEIDQA